MSPVEVLKKEVEGNVERLNEAVLMTPFETPKIYADFLAQTYYFVCHSTRLLALASARFPFAMNSFHYRYAEHIKEEKGHEMMAANDLKHLGFDLKDFPEHSETQAFYQTQYYQIEHVSPVAFWGYVFCLESFAISGGVDIYNRVRKKFGEKPTLFLKVHVKEDVGHVEEAYEILKDVTAEQVQQIISNMKLSCDLYTAIYQKINRVAAAEELTVAV